jgi:hypothetical protein
MEVSVTPASTWSPHGRGALRLQRGHRGDRDFRARCDDPGVEPTLHPTPGASGHAGGITDIRERRFSVTYALTTDRRR